jgi:hypothetical protein
VSLLKRPEVILLLILALGGAWFVLSDKKHDGAGDFATNSAPATDAEPALKIHRRTLERDYGNARLDIDLRHANTSATKLALQPPAARLVTAAGREVPAFFLPFEPPPEIPAKTAADVRLRYWLEKTDLAGAITLHIGEATAEIKSATPFDLEKLENKKPRTFDHAEWKE